MAASITMGSYRGLDFFFFRATMNSGMKQRQTEDQPIMGEVRIEVKLTNYLDWEQAQEGNLKPDRVRVVTADAMVDTGAVRCTLPPHVAHRLGLKARRTQVVEYADGRKEEVGV